MRRIVFALLLLTAFPSLALASRDSTLADTTNLKRGKVWQPRSTSVSTPEDSVKWGTEPFPYESVTADTIRGKRYAKISRAKIDSLATDSLTARAMKAPYTLNGDSVAGFRSIHPFTLVIDAAGKGDQPDIGTRSTNSLVAYVKNGTYSTRITLSGTGQRVYIEPGSTLSGDSLLVTGQSIMLILGGGTSIANAVRVGGTNNTVRIETGVSATGTWVLNGRDYLLEGDGDGSLITSSGASAVNIKLAGRGIVRRIQSHTSGSTAWPLQANAGSDSSIIQDCLFDGVYATGLSAHYLLFQGNVVNGKDGVLYYTAGNGCRIVGNHIVNLASSGTSGGIYLSGVDCWTVANNFVTGWTGSAAVKIAAGADSGIVSGNNLHHGGISDGGAANISANLNVTR